MARRWLVIIRRFANWRFELYINLNFLNFPICIGNKWRKDRKLLTPAFHFQILDGFFDVFNRNSQIFVEQISKRILDENEVDIYPMTSRCTLDIICGIISILSPFQAYSCIEIIYDLIRGCHGNSDKRSSELRF